MTAFARSVATLTGMAEQRLERLAGGDLSEVLLVRHPDGRRLVAKGGAAIATEAAMLRFLAGKSIPVPTVDADYPDVLLLEHIENDGVFSPTAWRDIAGWMRRLHEERGESYGWPVDYRLGTVELDNRQTMDWPAFWGEQRLIATASLLDRPWRERIRSFVRSLPDLIGQQPPISLLHGDLWTGNILVRDGRLTAFIDPACYYGDPEVDLAMLSIRISAAGILGQLWSFEARLGEAPTHLPALPGPGSPAPFRGRLLQYGRPAADRRGRLGQRVSLSDCIDGTVRREGALKEIESIDFEWRAAEPAE